MSYPVGRCAFAGKALLVLVCVGAVLQAGAWWQWWPTGALVPWRFWAASGVWYLVLVLAWLQWRRLPVGWLIWDPALDSGATGRDPVLDTRALNEGWWWGSDAGLHGQALAQVQSVWMGQRRGLLRVRFDGDSLVARGVWLCVEQRSAPERWLALRRALLGQTL